MASAAAAVIARARREIQHQFFSQDAVRPDRAIPFEPSRHIELRQFERMRRRGIIHEARAGRYWLDVVAYDVDLRDRYHRIKTALFIMIALFIAALALPFLGLR